MTVTLDWIVCGGAERSIVEQRVACPRSQPGFVDAEDCFLCRHLMATPIDRLADGQCATDALAAPELLPES